MGGMSQHTCSSAVSFITTKSFAKQFCGWLFLCLHNKEAWIVMRCSPHPVNANNKTEKTRVTPCLTHYPISFWITIFVTSVKNYVFFFKNSCSLLQYQRGEDEIRWSFEEMTRSGSGGTCKWNSSCFSCVFAEQFYVLLVWVCFVPSTVYNGKNAGKNNSFFTDGRVWNIKQQFC